MYVYKRALLENSFGSMVVWKRITSVLLRPLETCTGPLHHSFGTHKNPILTRPYI